MAERKTGPPSSAGPPPKGSPPGRPAARLRPDQYDLKIRWENVRKVLDVSTAGVSFESEAALKVGVKYPISLSAPGVSFPATIEVTRCQLTVEPSGHRFFHIDARFFPYVE